MNRRLAVLASIFLIAVIVGSTVWYIETRPPGTDKGSIIWETDLPSTATDIAVADQKVFLADKSTLYCLSTTDGSALWNTSYGFADYGSRLTVYINRVYVATVGLMIRSLNENTGQAEFNYTAPPTGVNDHKRTADILLADGKLFAYGAGTAVYNAANGQELWEQSGRTWYEPQMSDAAQKLPPSNYTYIVGPSRVNPNSGETIWSFPAATSYPPIVCQDKVILWNYASKYNYPQTEHAIVCLNADTGEQLWRADPDAAIFQPGVSGDLLLFASQDGNFYALDLSDGNQEWKVGIDDLEIIKSYNQTIRTGDRSLIEYVNPSPPLIDAEHNRLFWSVFDSHQVNGNKTNLGSFMCLNIQSGNRVWYKPVVNDTSFHWGGQSMAVLNDELFISANYGVICLNAANGDVQWVRHLDSYFFTPLLVGDRVYLLSDKHLIVYK